MPRKARRVSRAKARSLTLKQARALAVIGEIRRAVLQALEILDRQELRVLGDTGQAFVQAKQGQTKGLRGRGLR